MSHHLLSGCFFSFLPLPCGYHTNQVRSKALEISPHTLYLLNTANKGNGESVQRAYPFFFLPFFASIALTSRVFLYPQNDLKDVLSEWWQAAALWPVDRTSTVIERKGSDTHIQVQRILLVYTCNRVLTTSRGEVQTAPARPPTLCVRSLNECALSWLNKNRGVTYPPATK